MSKSKSKAVTAASVRASFCEEHLHISFRNKKGREFAEITLSLEDGVELLGDLFNELGEITGMELYIVDPSDPIGPTVGNA
jgi:hypothetical protein